MKPLSTLLAAAAFVLTVTSSVVAQETRIATFAGGCFWCIESDFDKVPGVLKTISGYTGGRTLNPTYRQVARGNTGHREASRQHPKKPP